MAKQIKVISGYYNNYVATTIYTVPAGRTAKVELVHFNCVDGGNSKNINAGGRYMLNEAVGQVVMPAIGSNAVHVSLIPYYSTSSATYKVARRFAYLNAGQVLQVTGYAMDYEFVIVEEY